MAEIERMVSRDVEPDGSSLLFTLTHSVMSIPCPTNILDAISVAPGLGEHGRVIQAIEAWERLPAAKHLFVTGTNDIEVAQPQLSLKRLKEQPFNLQRTRGVFAQVSAEHTREQADWLIMKIYETKVKHIAFYASHWHLPRAYATLIKSMLDNKKDRPIVAVYPVFIGSAPNTRVPDLSLTVSEASAGEAKRIPEYQSIGQVATWDELSNYLSWLWDQLPSASSNS